MKASKITAVDFFDDLTSPYARKRFFWGFLLLAALCAAAIFLERTYFLDNSFRAVIEALAIELLANIIMVLGFYSLYMYFIGPNTGLREVTVTRPRDIRERMEALLLETRYYSFWGRSGSYFRSTPLLKLDELARRKKIETDIDVLLPDPTDERLIKSYRDILTSLGETSEGNPLLSHVLATSITCAVIAANNKHIRIKLYYSKFLPAFRVDISDNGAILTQDDPGKSALFFEAGSEFYEMFRTTMRNEMAVSKEISWDKSLFDDCQLDEKACNEKTLSAFGIKVENIDNLQQEVSRMIVERSHRYT